MSQNGSKPKDLTSLEYARHLLENVLAWPFKGNGEMLADCLTALSKSKHISLSQAHSYMERAIKLATEQGITVDRFFFQGGVYTTIRPSKVLPVYKNDVDKEALDREQSSAEWQEMSRIARAKLREIAEKTRMP